jgi:hypothetical protein
MPSIAEILKSSGLTDEEIAAIDAKAVTGLTAVLTAAETERSQAELAQRAATQMFETEITPALNKWGIDEANLRAEAAYYKAQAEGAKAGGFLPEVAPFKPAEPQRDNGGRFVPNANAVPGSPNFQDFENKVSTAFGTLSDLNWRYETLFGRKMPDSPTSLGAEAAAQRMSLSDYAAKKYDFAGKEASIKAEETKKREDAIRKEEREAVEKKYAEMGGTNPNVRQGQASQFSELKKGVTEGKREDPLKMTRDQRHAANSAAIRQDIANQTIQ